MNGRMELLFLERVFFFFFQERDEDKSNGGLVVKTLHVHCQGLRFDSRLGN